MSNQRHCLQCGRTIDEWARICPFCNWNQAKTDVPPPKVPVAAEPAAPAMLEERRALKRKGLLAAAGATVLVASFAVGMVINRDGAPKVAPETLDEQAATKVETAPVRADTPLVPAGVGGLQPPITSAPAATASNANMPTEYSRTDATAVSALEYAQMEKRALAEKSTNPSFVDPRTLTGPAYAQSPAPRRPSPSTGGATAGQAPASAVARTRPVPEYQPLPPIRAEGTAKLTLLIGADGRVKEINVQRALQGGNTAALVASVQNWRFKPATAGGQPVAAPYSVDIKFR